MVLAPNHGPGSRSAAISAPRLPIPTQKTTTSSTGPRRPVVPRVVVGVVTTVNLSGGPWRARLAPRAPVRRSGLAGRTEVGLADLRAAADATALAAVDPVAVAGAAVAGRPPEGAVLVVLELLLRDGHDLLEVVHRSDRCLRCHARPAADLGLEDVA